MIFVWLKFLLCAAIIFFAGGRLTKYGDAIAEKTGLCRAWIGIVLLAVVTSLPEMANGISAVSLAKIPDLAAGDIFGACMINMFSLALLDLLWWARKGDSIFRRATESNLISALAGMFILLVASIAIALAHFVFDFSVLGISIYSIMILAVYFLMLRMLSGHREGMVTEKIDYSNLSNTQVYLNFFLAAVVVVIAGGWLPFIGGEIINIMGWDKTFVAVLFIALATTLPEMTVSFSALRMGEVGMGIGNLVGSNIFNVSLIFIIDIFYRPASVLAAVSLNMIYAALFGALFMGLAYFAMRKRVNNHLPSFIIIFLYLTALFILFQAGLLS